MTKKVANFVLLLVAIIAALAGLSLWAQPPYDPDLGWHLFGGSFIAAHHQVPDRDLINSFSTRWHDYHWFAQLILFQIFDLASYRGLSIALGIASALFFLILVAFADRKGMVRRSPIITVVAITFVLLLISKVTSVRPQVMSLLLLALTLFQLSTRACRAEAALLLAYAILAANIHVYWVFVPFLYFIFRVLGAHAERRSFYYSILVFLLLCGAALVSPYGIFHDQHGWLFENYALIYDYLVMPDELRQTIGELQSSFASGGIAPILLCLMTAIFVRGFKRSDLNAHRSDLIIALVSFVLAVRATKFLAIFALFSFPYFLLCLFRVTRPLRSVRLTVGSQNSFIILTALSIISLMTAIISFPREVIVTNQLHDYLPLKACSAIARLPLQATHGRDHVRVLTHFNYGGWCRWIMFQEAPEKDLRVTTDGRTQWFPPEFFVKAIDLYNARFDWLKTLKEWSPDVILVPRDKPLANVLVLAKGDWKLEYEDSNFAVFTPKH